MLNDICCFAALVLSGLLVALIAFSLLRKSLSEMLDEAAKIPACTTFYLRLLAIGAIFIALSGTVGERISLDKNAHVMEYVWKIAENLSGVFGLICLFLTGYLIAITIFVAVLRRKNV
ncbi:hypothetical protein JW916_06780 [Candidatus Sumerlaeota bacterium]|nr:hypothetical protein [Candidatus Sumerlaeota bacterium]